jgi:apolipoprotein N-acyltransferase
VGASRLILPWSRCGAQALALALVFAAGPGILREEGVFALAVPGLALWARSARRAPVEHEPRTWLAEWLALALLVGAEMAWIVHVAASMLPVVAFGLALPLLVAPVALRRLTGASTGARPSASLPFALALPLAWVGAEAFQHLLPLPFGVSWLDLGNPWIHAPLVGGSARVWGVWGLSWCAAALAGAALDVFDRRRPLLAPLALGLGPLVLAIGAALATSPGKFAAGPRLLLVQPGIPQELKNAGDDEEARDGPGLILRPSLQHTQLGLAAAREAGGPDPDLVCWSETMFPAPVLARGMDERFEQGLAPPRVRTQLGLEDMRNFRDWERLVVRGVLYGETLPKGWPTTYGHVGLGAHTSFLSGAEVIFEQDGAARRGNGVVLWSAPDAHKQPFALKQFLVPGAETFYGLEKFELVQQGVDEFAPYVPDLARGEHTGVFELPRAAGRPVRFSATVCFDNAFAEPYVSAVADEAAAGRCLDFHLVATNEAWYRGGYELDQMLCFSRLAAIASGRALVRVGNDGITVAFDAHGRELSRLRARGIDREVAGALEVVVPVPADPAEAVRTPYTATWRAWPWLAAAALAAAWVWARPRNRRAAAE